MHLGNSGSSASIFDEEPLEAKAEPLSRVNDSGSSSSSNEAEDGVIGGRLTRLRVLKFNCRPLSTSSLSENVR